MSDATALSADLRVTGSEMRLPPDIELAAFRIAQEAVNNVIRHADAMELLVTLDFGEHDLRLRVVDDGRGFDLAELDAHLTSGHLGIHGMRERAALAGGSLTVQSGPGHGTVIAAVLGPPLGERADGRQQFG